MYTIVSLPIKESEMLAATVGKGITSGKIKVKFGIQHLVDDGNFWEKIFSLSITFYPFFFFFLNFAHSTSTTGNNKNET